MAFSSFDSGWQCNDRSRVQIYILEVCDRDAPEDEPIAWLLVERQETYEYDKESDSYFSANIRLAYRQIQARNFNMTINEGFFVGSYAGFDNVVSLTSSTPHARGAVYLDLPGMEGQRIGTHFFNEIVVWAQQWPKASVQTIELSVGEAGNDNKARRNRLYEQFEITFKYKDSSKREGLSKPMLVEDLKAVKDWKENIQVLDIRDYLAILHSTNKELIEKVDQGERAAKNLSSYVKGIEAKPLRWAWSVTWPGVAPTALLLLLGAVAWFIVKPNI